MAGRVVRFGLPLVLAIFYASAVLGFDYTSEGAYVSLEAARRVAGSFGPFGGAHIGGVASPLWVALLAAAGGLHLDLVLTAKVLSLTFSCVALVLSYFLAYEVLIDHVAAFCVALAVGMQYWLLQAAPSGTPLACALAMVLACLFVLMRNEYLLATLFAALAALIYWQAASLMVAVAADLFLNSTSLRRARHAALATLLVFLAALLPWGLCVAGGATEMVYDASPATGLPSLPLLIAFALFGLAGIALGTQIAALRKGWEGWNAVRVHAAILIWICLAAAASFVKGGDLWVLVVPALIVYAAYGVRSVAAPNGAGAGYTAIFVLTALLLLVNQAAFYRSSKSAMREAATESVELTRIAAWLDSSVPDSAGIAGEHAAVLEYYSGRAVQSLADTGEPPPRFVVTSAVSVPGFETAYRPPIDEGSAEAPALSVWKRR